MADPPGGAGEGRIGRFRLDRVLGTGGFATVWLAYDENLDAFVAIKVLAENWSHNEEIRRRFTDEARILWRMESPHIVRVYGVDTTPEGRPYFVMEYADAGSLEERMKARTAAGERTSVAEALAISIAVADGLVEAQGRNIVHRDLKPSNILFKSTDGGAERLVIADFGIARSLEAAGASTIAAGTPHYMAPEQSEGRAEASSDVYSSAVILYEMLAGRVPFPYPSVGQVIRAQITETVPDIRSLRPDVSDRLAAVIARGVDARPEARQRTAEEWRADLLALSEDRAADAVAGQQETLGPEALAALGGAATVGAAAAAGAAATSGHGSAPAESFREPVSSASSGGGAAGRSSADAASASRSPSGAAKRRRRRRVLALLVVLALIGGIAGIAISSSGKVSGEVIRVPANVVGANAFTTPAAKPNIGGISLASLVKLLKAPSYTLAPPKGAPAGSIASFYGNTPGLYGGTQQLSVCDAAAVVSYLAANPAKAAAWAAVEGITASQIPAYIGSLTDAVLRVDTRVTNHGYVNGTANPIQEVLQAGTAVLVDKFGVPRLRCYCGNPLTPPVAVSAPQYSGPSWTGFEPSQTEVIVPSSQPVTTLVLIGIPSGTPLLRTPGPNDGADTPAPPSVLAGSPFAPTATLASTTTANVCTSWSLDQTTLSLRQGTYYTPTVAITGATPTSTGENLSGSVILPEGQWENAGHASPENSFVGAVIRNHLTFLVVAPKVNPPPTTSLGDYEGTILAAASFKVGEPTAIDVVGTAYDRAVTPPAPKVSWVGTGQATCVQIGNKTSPSTTPTSTPALAGPTTSSPAGASTTTTAPKAATTTSTPVATTAPPPPPTTAPPVTCSLPGSLSVEGGNPSSLSGSGGTSQVVSEPVVISTGPLTDCGHHYELSMTSSGGGTYTDCEMSGMTDDVSGETNVGDTMTISLVLPPNSCG